MRMLRTAVAAGASAATVAALIAAPVTGHAATTCPTSGVNTAIAGTGSSFQNPLVQAEISSFDTTCSAGSPWVSYTTGGSGHGITALTDRSVQFAGSDIPYNELQLAQLSTGVDLGGLNSIPPSTSTLPSQHGAPSPVATFPIAIGAVTVSYNIPCSPTLDANGRFDISNLTLGQIYSGLITDWSKVPGSNCAAGTAIKLVARDKSSGTTFAFKDYLSKVNALYDVYKQSVLNTAWPDLSNPANVPNSITGRDLIQDAACDAITTSHTLNNNVDVAQCVKGLSGAIGYTDFSDANTSTLTWAAIDNASQTFSAPALGGCTTAAEVAPGVAAAPPSALADWSQESITYLPQGYGDCTYTYTLALVAPHTAGAASASQTATIRDWVCYEVGDGQAQAAAHNYDALPTSVASNMQRDCSLVLTDN